ncbi:hypothetical protein SAMN02745166_01162 [Prosthecobacter debontii]|uniref:Uncharacterized protein n=1 Tax=Prosthecobacter debontii TaxID=48467 RepID=A0A1T4X8W7_9BACT|nr:hypothetical protein SAMN02745166_01162 [Prosthecobacter debontii]
MVRLFHAFASLLLCAARHITAVGLLCLLACLLWTLLYGGLLIYAGFTDGRPGGPLAYPAGLILILIFCLWVGGGIFAPACGIGFLMTRLTRCPQFAAVPIVFIAGFGLTWLMGVLYADHITTSPRPELESVLWSYLLFFSLPLGLYWWLVEGPWAFLDFLQRLWKRYQLRRASTMRLSADR